MFEALTRSVADTANRRRRRRWTPSATSAQARDAMSSCCVHPSARCGTPPPTPPPTLMVRRWRLIGHFPILYNPHPLPRLRRPPTHAEVRAAAHCAGTRAAGAGRCTSLRTWRRQCSSAATWSLARCRCPRCASLHPSPPLPSARSSSSTHEPVLDRTNRQVKPQYAPLIARNRHLTKDQFLQPFR